MVAARERHVWSFGLDLQIGSERSGHYDIRVKAVEHESGCCRAVIHCTHGPYDGWDYDLFFCDGDGRGTQVAATLASDTPITAYAFAERGRILLYMQDGTNYAKALYDTPGSLTFNF